MDRLRRLLFQGSPMRRACSHLDQIETTTPKEATCPDCIDTGARWVHVRMCMTCGQRGCCDSSKSKHARRHHEQTGHPLIRSVEPGESWAFCYLDDAYMTESEYVTTAD